MMRVVRRRARLLALVLGTALLFGAAGAANAYNTFNGHKLTYGVNGQYYWMDQSAVDSHPNAIPAGVDAWNDTTDTKVYYKRTYTKSQSRMDFYRRSTSSGSYCAITAMYVDTSVVNQNSQNWTWGKVTVDPLLTNVSACGADTHRKGIIAHEQGHVMGLAHSSSSGHLMYDQVAATSVNTPRTDDRNGINALY
jgi:hypothetical protein